MPLAYLLIFRRDARPEFWLVALGFMVSWFADAVNLFLDPAPWVVTHYYPALQLGMFGMAFGVWWSPMVLIGGAMLIPIGMEPEMIVTALGSVLILTYAEIRGGPLRAPIWAYCFVATIFYVLMGVWMTMGMWWGYQVSRMLAFVLFLRAARGER